MISLCMIAKNEEKHLEQCLESVKNVVDEIIVIDTGSTDKTKEIAKKFGAKIIDFKWVDDFSAARNESLKHASKDWILVLDADEVLDDEGCKAIKELVEDEEADAFLFLQKNYTNESSIRGFVDEEHKKGDKVYLGWYGSFIARLFRNNKGYKFEGIVHELVEPFVERNKGNIKATNIQVHHYGNADPNDVKKKRQFYLELCKKKINANPNSGSYCELGVLYKENSNFDEAANAFKKSIELNPKNSMAFYELGIVYEKQDNYDDAVMNYTESLKIKEDSEAFQNLGVCYLKKGMFKESYTKLVKAMLLNPNNYTIYNNLGALFEKQANYDSAVQVLEIATKLNRKNMIGFYNLGIAYDKKGDFEKALSAYEKAIELKHKKSEDIKKRINELKKIIENSTKFSYGFKVGS